jgi:hypothetical protein
MSFSTVTSAVFLIAKSFSFVSFVKRGLLEGITEMMTREKVAISYIVINNKYTRIGL